MQKPERSPLFSNQEGPINNEVPPGPQDPKPPKKPDLAPGDQSVDVPVKTQIAV
jgi:hypothetical protein